MKLQDLVKLKPIIDAIERGKQLQSMERGLWEDYDVDHEISEEEFCRRAVYSEHGLRVKPEPRECLIPEDMFEGYRGNHSGSRVNLIKVREVIE